MANKKKGYILLHRSLLDHWIYSNQPYDKCHAWVDLLLLANFESKKAMCRGKVVECKRGTVNLSISELAERWGWTWRKTKNYLKLLEAEQMCLLNSTRERTTITIVKYDDYQPQSKVKAERNAEQSAEHTAQGQQNGQHITNEYKKKDNELKESNSPSAPEEDPDFDWFESLEDDRDNPNSDYYVKYGLEDNRVEK